MRRGVLHGFSNMITFLVDEITSWLYVAASSGLHDILNINENTNFAEKMHASSQWKHVWKQKCLTALQAPYKIDNSVLQNYLCWPAPVLHSDRLKKEPLKSSFSSNPRSPESSCFHSNYPNHFLEGRCSEFWSLLPTCPIGWQRGFGGLHREDLSSKGWWPTSRCSRAHFSETASEEGLSTSQLHYWPQGCGSVLRGLSGAAVLQSFPHW